MINGPQRLHRPVALHEFNYNVDLHVASPFQSFQPGAGHPTMISHRTRPFPTSTRKTGARVRNLKRRKVTKVWRHDEPVGMGYAGGPKDAVILRQTYLVKHPLTGDNLKLVRRLREIRRRMPVQK
ncbi:hypothetical protein FB45DRAFT_36346 [Roridomyces roridus]|uniref:Uncharacterized protein n=1 Tax=Roridomyces roridus TaxID=1738132 RepID=A0AAD7BQT8_9AGAR|nr:hypothetical protein FB45DRAFT_36346 [Roridomyces roridus]